MPFPLGGEEYVVCAFARPATRWSNFTSGTLNTAHVPRPAHPFVDSNNAGRRTFLNTHPSSPSSLAARVTARIIAALNHGVRPWQQPWSTAAALALPLRHNSIPYRGFNTLALWEAAQQHGFTARHWFSFKQAQALGAHVRRGARGTPIIFYSDGHTTDETASTATTDASPPTRAFRSTYVVFSANQIDGLPAHFYAHPPPSADHTDLAARLDPLFDRVPAHITHGGARACYDPATDTIHLPPRHAFVSLAQYCATRLHELAHWTGHTTRLARDAFVNSGPRAVTAYAREELIAELTAAFLGAELNLPVDHLEDHAAYLDHWLKILDRDPGALLTAAGHAQRAADFLRPFLFEDAITPVTPVAPVTPATHT